MKKILLLIGLVLLVLPLALALKGTSQQQTSGGETYYFYYADKNNVDDHHLFAAQTFVMDSSEYVIGIYLKLRKIAGSIWNPCWFNDKFEVELRDKYDDTVASQNNLAVCDLSSSFKWKQIKLTQPVKVEPGEKYKIVVLYKGNALKESPNFAWERSIFDTYTGGSSTDGNFVESSKDFTFKIRGYK